MKVLEVLGSSDSKEGVSQQRLIAETGLSERAVKYAVRTLVLTGFAAEEIDMRDIRKKLYTAGGIKK